MDERMGGSIRYPYSWQGVLRVLTSRRKLQFCESCCDHMLKVSKALARLNVNILHDMRDCQLTITCK